MELIKEFFRGLLLPITIPLKFIRKHPFIFTMICFIVILLFAFNQVTEGLQNFKFSIWALALATWVILLSVLGRIVIFLPLIAIIAAIVYAIKKSKK